MNQEYKTTDIALGSAIITKGGTLTEVRKLGYSQAEFTITGKGIEEIVINFQNRKLKLDAMTLFETHKSLKARANDILRNTY